VSEIIRVVQANHAWVFLGCLLWVSLLMAASVVYRRSRGKVIYPTRPKDSLYYEGWASGRSNTNLFTKVGGANNCLMVAVTPDFLIIQPRFPFNLMFLPELLGLEYRIPKVDVRGVEKKGGLFGKGVEVHFVDADGGSRSVRLYLRRTDEFLAAMGIR
jgi:hypothetical protein